LPYWTLDIGAFFVKRSTAWYWNGDYDLGNKDFNYRELYTRWFQYATFLPILRAHGTDTRREVWQFGEKGEPYYDAIVKFIELRYHLIPYIYSMAGLVTQENYTMLRLLAFNYNNDPKVHSINDQFLFGDAMMICPITEAVYERNVYLPLGNDWYDYWTNTIYKGGTTVNTKAPINQIPIYVKSGAIIPTTSLVQCTNEIDDTDITLNIYTGKDGHFRMYQDEGNNYNYEKKYFSTFDIIWHDRLRTLECDNRKGTYQGMPKIICIQIILNGQKSLSFNYVGEKIIINL